DNLTLATFRSAELGFLGVWVLTCRHTPFLNGDAKLVNDRFLALKKSRKAGVVVFFDLDFLFFRTN
ncbi:MAG: hypothetical protein UW65_C0018G0003, partial [candidate division WWE3 bacterium GW2011_GWB1_44_4]